MKNALQHYCKGKGISMAKFSRNLDLGINTIWKINEDPKRDVSTIVIDTIYTKTKEMFGEGLTPRQYLDRECFNR